MPANLWARVDRPPPPSPSCHATIHFEPGKFTGHVFGPSKFRVLKFADELVERFPGWVTSVRWSEMSKMARVSGQRP